MARRRSHRRTRRRRRARRSCRTRSAHEGRPEMETLWFALVALMLVAYVVLDGFDLGAGIIQPFVAKTDDERRLVIRSIGPVWDGNEVGLLATGGALYFALSRLYASSFIGLYLPRLMGPWRL